MSRKENDLNRPPQRLIQKTDLSKIKEEITFYRETIDYLMNRGVTFPNCIRIVACMEIGDSFPAAILQTFSSTEED